MLTLLNAASRALSTLVEFVVMKVNGYKIEPGADLTGTMMPDGSPHD